MTRLKLSRRGALIAAGGATTLAAVGGLLGLAAARGGASSEGDAYAPWRLWDEPSQRATPTALAAAAILAANPHDTQPWLFRVSNQTIELFADLSRHLGAMDPYVREMHLGLGCAIENLLIAAGPNGYDAEVEAAEGSLIDLTDRSRPVLAAIVRLRPRAATPPDSLYRAIPARHTNRTAYDRGRAVPADWLEFARQIGDDAGVRVILFGEGEERRRFDAAVVEATQAIIDDEMMIADSDRWFRGSAAEIDAHRDGPTLEAAGLSWLTLNLARLFPVSPETTHSAWLGQTRDVQVPSAPLAGLIAVRDRYDRPAAIAAGRIWQRLHLAATVRGIAMQPLNQPIERIDRERQSGGAGEWSRRIAALTGEGWQATFAFRSGYAAQSAPPSPRRRLADVLVG